MVVFWVPWDPPTSQVRMVTKKGLYMIIKMSCSLVKIVQVFRYINWINYALKDMTHSGSGDGGVQQ